MRLNFFVLMGLCLGLTVSGQNLRWVYPGSFGVAAGNSNYLVTGGGSGLIKLWTYSNSVPRFVKTLSSDSQVPIWTLSMAEDGSTIVSVDGNGSARVWNVGDGSSYEMGGGRMSSVQHSRWGNLLGIMNGGSEIQIYDLSAKTNIAAWQMDGARPFVFAPRDRVATYYGEVIRLYAISNGMFREFIFPTSARSEVRRLAFSADGSKMAAAAFLHSQLDDSLLAIWDLNTGAVQTLGGDGHVGLEFSPDGSVLAAQSDDEVAFRNVQSKELIRSVQGVGPLVFVNTNQVVVGNEVVTISTGARVPFVETIASMHALKFSDDGTVLASESALWDANTGALLTTLKPWPQTNAPLGARYIQPIVRGVTPIRFGPTNTIIVRQRIFDRTTGEQVAQLPVGFPTDLAENWYYTSPWDSTNVAELRRYSDGQVLRTLFLPNTGGSSAIGTSPSQTLVATYNAGGEEVGKVVRLWNAADGSFIRAMTNRVQVPYRLAFSSDEKVLAAGSEQYGGEVSVWDVQSGRQIFAGNAGLVPAIGFDLLHGSNFLIWGYNGLNVTDLQTGFTSMTITNEAFQVQTVAVSPDQTRIAFARRDGTLVMMDTPRVDRLSVQSSGGIYALSFLTLANQNYTLESSADLKSWSFVANIVGTGGRFEREIPGGQTIFYRLRGL